MNSSIKVVSDVWVEETVGLHSPGQTDRDDLVLVETQVSDDVLNTNIYLVDSLKRHEMDLHKVMDSRCFLVAKDKRWRES